MHNERLDNDNVLEIFGRYDLIVDGTDNFATRYMVNDACVLLGKPYVWGSIYRFEGQASVFWAEHGPQYRDLYPEPPPPGMVPSCAEGGVLGVLCASIGSIMGTEAIKLITGIGETLLGRLMIYDALEMSYRTVKIRKDPNGEPITELIDYDASAAPSPTRRPSRRRTRRSSVKQLKEMLDEREARRDRLRAHRRARAQRVGHRPHPRRRADPQGRVPQRQARSRSCRRTSRSCCTARVGGRSAEVLAVMKGAGFSDAVHVGGGVVAWVNQIEPDKPSY